MQSILVTLAIAAATFLSQVSGNSGGTGSCDAGIASIENELATNTHIQYEDYPGSTSTRQGIRGTLADALTVLRIDGVDIDPDATTSLPVDVDLVWEVVSGPVPFKGIFARVEKASDDFTNIGSDATLQPVTLCDVIPGVVGVTHTSSAEKPTSSGTINFSSAGEATLDVILVFDNIATSTYAGTTFALNVIEDGVPTSASPTPVAAPITVPAPVVDVPVAVPVEVPVAVPVEAPINIPIEVPVDVPVDVPVETPVDVPVAIPVEPPIDTPIDTPVAVPVEVPVEVPIAVPVDVPVEAPVDVPVDAPVEVPVNIPSDTPSPIETTPPVLEVPTVPIPGMMKGGMDKKGMKQDGGGMKQGGGGMKQNGKVNGGGMKKEKASKLKKGGKEVPVDDEDDGDEPVPPNLQKTNAVTMS